jgi:NAD(P)-dependent dehydrogenase (short-subunit alcohol dehydrogenase family)
VNARDDRGDRRRWTAANIPDQAGRTAIVTGANTGIGFETARRLAERGASLILACRSIDKARIAAERISAMASGQYGQTKIEIVHLDLADLASVRQAANHIRSRHNRIDLLINNAGVMLSRTQTGNTLNLEFAINHLGHFALTGLVLDCLLATPGSRVVTVSSNGHLRANNVIVDLRSETIRAKLAAYSQSKLANLLFTYELQRRLSAVGAHPIAVAAHPGFARSGLFRDAPALVRVLTSPRLRLLNSLFSQAPGVGALATLRAATDPDVAGGDYFGPGGRFHVVGYPVPVRSSAHSHDRDLQDQLWTESERLSGVAYGALSF